MNIDDALRELQLGARVLREDAPYHWFGSMEFEGQQLCAGMQPPLEFAFIADDRLQAYAAYQHNLVLMTAGLLDFLCKLAGHMVQKGIFSSQHGSQAAPIAWDPDPARSGALIRGLVIAEAFDVRCPPWGRDDPQAGLYFFVLLNLFRFVVLHEIGHIYHQHGRRFTRMDSLEVDAIGPAILNPGGALDAQARELVADGFAIDMLLQLMESEVDRVAKTSLTAPLATSLLASEERRIVFGLTLAYIYFSATDRHAAVDPVDAMLSSHPPAAFRLVTIVAGRRQALETRVGAERARVIALSAGLAGDAALAIAFNRRPNREWLANMDDERFSRHYESLHARLNAWVRPDVPLGASANG